MLMPGRYLTKGGHEANVSIQEEEDKFVGHVQYIGFIAWDKYGIRIGKNPNDMYDSGDNLDIVISSFVRKG